MKVNIKGYNWQNVLTKIFYILFAIIIGSITITTAICKKSAVYSLNPLITIAVTFIYLAVMGLIYFKFIRNIKVDDIINWKFIRLSKIDIKVCIIMLIFLISQIIIMILYRVNPSWDFGWVFGIASQVATGEHIQGGYLIVYPNNIGVTILLSIVFKIATMFGTSSLNVVGILTNVIFIDATIIIVYLVCKKIYGSKIALMALIIICSITPMLFYTPIYYTDTLSILFPILAIYLVVLYEETKSKKAKIILPIAIGLTLFIGMEIKFTVIITLIAITIYYILNKRVEIKERFRLPLISIATLILLFIAFTFAIRLTPLYNKELSEQKQMPYTHHIMMGLSKDGGYNDIDPEFTASFKTQVEKKAANIEEIKKRLSDYGFVGYIKFLGRKISYTWNDGTFFASMKLLRDPVNLGDWHEYISIDNDKNMVYKYISQATYLAMLLLMTSSAIITVFKNRAIEYKDILSIAIIGIFIFLLMWETRSRYLVNYIPFMSVIAADGICKISKIDFAKISFKKGSKK